MEDRELGAAVIGLGVGRAHAAAYRSISGVRLAAVASLDAPALARAAEEWPPLYATTDWREAIDRPEVDVVSICTPDREHVEQSVYALERGKHVLCEKPIAADMAGLRRLREAVNRSGATFAACHNYRFFTQFAQLRQVAARGDLGPLHLVDTCYIQDLWGMRSLGPAYWRFAHPQDLFIGGAVHNVDLLYWLAGEITEVQSFASNTLDFWPVENNHSANLRFRSGCIGHVLLELGAKRKRKFECRLRAFGPEGSVEADTSLPAVLIDRGDGPGDAPTATEVLRVEPHTEAVRDFLGAVRTGGSPMVGIGDAARVMAACYAVVRSAREGRVVTVESLE